jgi:hypothetical protein
MRPDMKYLPLDEDLEGLIDESHVESPELRAALDEAIRDNDEGNDPGIEITRENKEAVLKWLIESSSGD